MRKKVLIDGICLVVGVSMIALAYNIFLYPYQIISGSAAGLATILANIFPLNSGYIVFAINLPVLIGSFVFLGMGVSIKTAIGGSLLPALILLFEGMPKSTVGVLGNAALGGILTGLGISFLYQASASTGGTAAIAQILCNKIKREKGRILLILDGLIVLSGLFVFPASKIFTSLFCVFCLTTTVSLAQFFVVKFKFRTLRQNQSCD